MTHYLAVEDIILINAEVIRVFGGAHAVRDIGGLESALGRLHTGYYADIIEEAAALFESLSQNHPFIDGNKRTAMTAMAVLLMMNDYRLTFSDVETYDWLIGLYESGKVSKTAMEAWLRAHCQIS